MLKDANIMPPKEGGIRGSTRAHSSFLPWGHHDVQSSPCVPTINRNPYTILHQAEACIHCVQLPTCLCSLSEAHTHTQHTPLTCQSLCSTFPANTHVHTNKKHGNRAKNDTRNSTLLDNMCTRHIWSQVQTHAHNSSTRHLIRLWKLQGDGSLCLN